MGAEVVKSVLVPANGRETITIMDDYGTPFQLSVSVSESANRQTNIDAAIAKMNAAQSALEAYATTHGIDLTGEKAAGAAKKAAMLAGN